MAASETSAALHAAAADKSVPSRATPKVSVVIPAFNESARIADTVRRVDAFLRSAAFSSELIVVDDGSADNTSEVVRNLQLSAVRLIQNSENHGKGYAVSNGVLQAAGEYVLFSDADLSSPIQEIEKLLDVALGENADVVIGSRALDRRLIERHQSRMREAGGILFNRMVRLLLGLDLHDTQCGFKLFKRECVLPVFKKLTIWGFGFDPELLFVAHRSGLSIREVPVRWSHAEGSKIRFLSDGTRMFADLLRIRWNFFAGRYS